MCGQREVQMWTGCVGPGAADRHVETTRGAYKRRVSDQYDRVGDRFPPRLRLAGRAGGSMRRAGGAMRAAWPIGLPPRYQEWRLPRYRPSLIDVVLLLGDLEPGRTGRVRGSQWGKCSESLNDYVEQELGLWHRVLGGRRGTMARANQGGAPLRDKARWRHDHRRKPGKGHLRKAVADMRKKRACVKINTNPLRANLPKTRRCSRFVLVPSTSRKTRPHSRYARVLAPRTTRVAFKGGNSDHLADIVVITSTPQSWSSASPPSPWTSHHRTIPVLLLRQTARAWHFVH